MEWCSSRDQVIMNTWFNITTGTYIHGKVHEMVLESNIKRRETVVQDTSL